MKHENKYPLDNPAKSSPQSRKKSPERILQEKKEKKARRSKRFGYMITISQGLLAAAGLGLLLVIDLLPFKYMVMIFLVLLLAFIFTWKTQGHKGIHIVGKIFGILTIPVLAVMIYGLAVVNLTFDSVANQQEEIAQVITDSVFCVHINDGGEDKLWLVNQDTHQILEVTTPDKYYITIPGVTEGQKDVLENAREHGAEAVRSTLGTLYETTIPYSVNISIDTLQSFINMENLKILIKPEEIIKVVDNNIETNLSKGQIRQLVKFYINEDATWELYPVVATGFGGRQKTYTNPEEETLVMEPDKQSVGYIIELLNRVEDGEKLKVSDLKVE